MEIEELELLLGPEDSEVDLREILMNARKKKGRRIFEIFSSQGPSEFLVVGRAVERVPKDAGDTRRRVKKEGTRGGLCS